MQQKATQGDPPLLIPISVLASESWFKGSRRFSLEGRRFGEVIKLSVDSINFPNGHAGDVASQKRAAEQGS